MAQRIEDIKKNYEKILSSPNFAFEVQKIIRDFNSLSLSEQKESKTFFQRIGQDLIERNVSAPNYDLKEFKKRIKDINRKKTPKKMKDIEFEDTFETVLQKEPYVVGKAERAGRKIIQIMNMNLRPHMSVCYVDRKHIYECVFLCYGICHEFVYCFRIML